LSASALVCVIPSSTWPDDSAFFELTLKPTIPMHFHWRLSMPSCETRGASLAPWQEALLGLPNTSSKTLVSTKFEQSLQTSPFSRNKVHHSNNDSLGFITFPKMLCEEERSIGMLRMSWDSNAGEHEIKFCTDISTFLYPSTFCRVSNLVYISKRPTHRSSHMPHE
jgi:hypothetical protein